MPDIDLLPSRIRPMDNELIAAIVAVLIAAAGCSALLPPLWIN